MGAIGNFVSIGFMSIGVYYALRSTDTLFAYTDSRRAQRMADEQLTLAADKARRQWLASKQSAEDKADV